MFYINKYLRWTVKKLREHLTQSRQCTERTEFVPELTDAEKSLNSSVRAGGACQLRISPWQRISSSSSSYNDDANQSTVHLSLQLTMLIAFRRILWRSAGRYIATLLSVFFLCGSPTAVSTSCAFIWPAHAICLPLFTYTSVHLFSTMI